MPFRANNSLAAAAAARAMLPKPNPAVLFQPLTEGAVLLHSRDEVYFGLNQVGANVWKLLPPTCTDFSELCSRLGSQYPEVASEILQSDVAELLAELQRQGLVMPSDVA
jgi:hypothetical protein